MTEQISNDTLIIRELDTLQDISQRHRDDFLTANWFDTVRDDYNLTPPAVATPSFRPWVNIPQHQILMLMEASDLADSDPTVYIVGPNGKRDQAREEAFMGQWRRGFYSLQILYASIWSLLGGTGFLQSGYDALSRRGFGETYIQWRDPSTVFPDPAAHDEGDWFCCQVIERLWPEQIGRRFPAAYAKGLVKPVPMSTPPPSNNMNLGMGGKLQMPPGPMSAMSYQPGGNNVGPSDGRRTVRYTFIFDSNIKEVAQSEAGTGVNLSKVIPAKYELRYPNGRYVVDCDGCILFDGDNPHPMGQFPITRLTGLPALTSFWAPPPSRYVGDLQNLASRMLRQVFENFIRTNNSIWILDGASGLTQETFSALPGEIVVIESAGKAPELKNPPAFPAHFLEYPKFLLSLVKELDGFSPAREGKSGSGNLGTDLFDSSVFQSQAITRMRAKLLASSIQRVVEQSFYTMAKYQNKGQYPSFETGFKLTDWKPIDPTEAHKYEVYLDPSSIRPISAQALRKLVPELRKLKMIDTRSALDLMGIPDAAGIADKVEGEAALEALARLKKR